MPGLGSSKRPAIVRVRSMERAEEIMSICEERGWKVIVGLEPGEPEDVSDVERLLSAPTMSANTPRIGRNDPCPCGSGLKYKNCCLRASAL